MCDYIDNYFFFYLTFYWGEKVKVTVQVQKSAFPKKKKKIGDKAT